MILGSYVGNGVRRSRSAEAQDEIKPYHKLRKLEGSFLGFDY